MQFFKNHSLKNYNTFGIDIKANTFFSFQNEDELILFLEKENVANTPYFILGGGSNVLFKSFFPGLILHSRMEDIQELSQDKESIILRVGSGLEWDKFVEYCVDNSYYGIENLSLIPGNVGAAPVQNIGAYGTEADEVIEGVSAYDLKTNKKVYLNKEECCFSYRNSVFKKPPYKSYIITTVDFKLYKIPPHKRKIINNKGFFFLRYAKHYKELLIDFFKAIKTLKINVKKRAVSVDYRLLKKLLENSGFISLKKVRRTIINKRNSKIPSPKTIGNVGSFFKNPIVDLNLANEIKEEYSSAIIYPLNETHVKISAGWLIKHTGWLNKQEDNVGLYKDQTLIIVNRGNATGDEIYNYSERIVESVFKKFKIKLEREVVVL
ncbi:FAD-binding protein [Winogradskyella immobilis]|uniref:UDP-N-acetylenolpyruvoylglucosamine reductase n=1 Tax=Winogradskyella immobilis TaxID=2816852 RepID=A0ABS8EJV8_9FLAO|nr:FAD-binding protein [Winogradskyella immobilis]MCC1483481.1 FAD-binding protein [Winogradskyella immobilis]MCG0015575.1 FAD-binding protein [Winogradskyella immobilis]